MPRCLRGGYILTPGGRRCAPGDFTDEGWPAGRKVGCRLPGWYALWVDIWNVAAEFVLAEGDIAKLIDFYNQTCGQPFKAQIDRSTSHVFAAKCRPAGDFKPAPARRVPEWAALLIATVDVQLDRFYWVIRAWGHKYRSQRVDHGQALSFEELAARCLNSAYPWASNHHGDAEKTRGERPPLRVGLLGIDSGDRPQRVYRFALSDLSRIKVLKGDKPNRRPIRVSRQTYEDPRRPRTPMHIYLHLLDVRYFKDLLAAAVRAKLEDGTDQWLLNDVSDDDYDKQMASEHKVLKRKGRSVPYETWEPVVDGAANHYWDDEVYQLAMADVARVDLIPPPRPAGAMPTAPGPRRPAGGGWEVKPLRMDQ